MATPPRSERRRFGRFQMVGRARCPVGGAIVVANILDLSRGGMRIAAKSGLRAQDVARFAVRLPDDDETLEVTGRVRRVDGLGTHVEFLPGQPEVDRRLKALVEKHVVPELEFGMTPGEDGFDRVLVLAGYYRELGRFGQALDVIRAARELQALTPQECDAAASFVMSLADAPGCEAFAVAGELTELAKLGLPSSTMLATARLRAEQLVRDGALDEVDDDVVFTDDELPVVEAVLVEVAPQAPSVDPAADAGAVAGLETSIRARRRQLYAAFLELASLERRLDQSRGASPGARRDRLAFAAMWALVNGSKRNDADRGRSRGGSARRLVVIGAMLLGAVSLGFAFGRMVGG